MEYKIDAADRILGRIATEVAVLLRGKNKPEFHPATPPTVKVVVFNTDKLRVSGKKMDQKLYRRHSGYHGGLKEVELWFLMERDSRRVLREAVMGMLPKNRSRAKMIRNLTLVKGNTA